MNVQTSFAAYCSRGARNSSGLNFSSAVISLGWGQVNVVSMNSFLGSRRKDSILNSTEQGGSSPVV